MKRYNKKIITIISIFVIVVCCLCSCKEKEIIGNGTINKTYSENPEVLTAPIFSDRGGFYENKMLLTLSVPEYYDGQDVKIRMTFDGSEPQYDSEEYKGEIKLPDVGCVETKFENSSENVKVTIVRAGCFNAYGKLLGSIASATFIQADNAKERFNLPVVSLVTDEENLNNSETGIFANSWGHGSEWERPVNISFFEEDGSLKINQDAGIRLFGGSTRDLTQKSFRITARKPEYFDSNKYSGGGKFKYAFFPERLDSKGNLLEEYDSIILRNGGNDSIFFGEDTSRITFMRDGIAAKISQSAANEVDAMDYRPVVVFLNGEYYGMMNLRERQDNKYIQNVYGIEDKEGITVISTEMDTNIEGRYDGLWFFYEQNDGYEGELEKFTSLINHIKSGNVSYEEASSQIDMNNFMKYAAMNLFLCNTDWPHNNVKIWRYAGENPGVDADTSVTDGKWRFMLKDVDLGLGRFVCGATKPGYPIELYTKADCQNVRFLLANYIDFENQEGYPSVLMNTYPDTLGIQGLFYFCMKNSDFADSFYSYCEELATKIWPEDKLIDLINSYKALLEKEMSNYLVKEFGAWSWKGNLNLDSWKNAVSGEDSLITWAKNRTGADGEFLKQINELKMIMG